MKNVNDYPNVGNGAMDLKYRVITLYLAQLQSEIEQGLIDPISEMTRLFPPRPRQVSYAAAAMALYEHYDEKRRRPLTEGVPKAH
jgi:hypothetical protein